MKKVKNISGKTLHAKWDEKFYTFQEGEVKEVPDELNYPNLEEIKIEKEEKKPERKKKRGRKKKEK